jgi:hypothetical protein
LVSLEIVFFNHLKKAFVPADSRQLKKLIRFHYIDPSEFEKLEVSAPQ